MNFRLWFYFGLVTMLLLTACQSDKPLSSNNQEEKLFVKLDSTSTGINFINDVQDGKDFNVLTYRNFYNGGGVGIADINNDGLDDIFFTANMESNRLFLNKGNFKFEDITDQAGIGGRRGWSTGVSMADVNADGLVDIYVSNSGDISGDDRENELYINNGDLTFTENAQAYNLANAGFSTHASFFDYDQDGDLDCYILNNSFKDPNKISSFSKTREEDDLLGGDRLMRNDGGKFVDVSKEAGIYTSAIGFGLGISVSDVNNDYLPDMYISNDFWERDYLYINQGDGTFSEELADRVSICSVSSMGADIADLNNNGSADIFTTDMLAADNYRLKQMTMFDPFFMENLKYRSSYHYQILQNCLQINDGTGKFQEMASMSDAAATDWSWGALIFDFENDGWNDIYVCNGIYKDIMDQDFTSFIADKEEVKKIVTKRGEFDFRDFLPFLPSTPINNYAFSNQKNNRFKNKAEELGFDFAEFSNGAAYGDLDNDGDLDLVINNVNMPASIYQNKADKTANNYLKIKLQDHDGKNNQGIGSIVTVEVDDKKYVKQLYTARGFQSNVSASLLFGLGDVNNIKSVSVIWPDQTLQTIDNVQLDSTIVIVKNTNTKATAPSLASEFLLAKDESIIDNIKHTENEFNDFDYEALMPRMHSTEGPKIEIADINGDGLDDMLVLGAQDDPDKILMQNASGKFRRIANPSLEADSKFESTCAAFFDSDGDGDLDLVIGSGGNIFGGGMDNFLLRYYENVEGQGFIKIAARTPPAGGQFSVIKPFDYDADGDIDLFIGARSIPGNYGLSPRSFLLRNDRSRWTDVTDKSLGMAGMITDATWVDFDSDGDTDLMVVGEWMPITFFENDGSTLIKGSSIKDSDGWWLDINANDLDGDGDTDFVLGNWGLNTKFKSSPQLPITMNIKDFDGNGKSEFIINWKPPSDNKLYPFASKMDITNQMPSLKKRILKYADYSNLSYEELFTAEERKGTRQMKASYLQTSILINDNGSFKLKQLPVEAQAAPIFASVVDDFDGDGIQDIWLGGNFYGLKPEVGRHNSTSGVLLMGDDDLNYTYSNENEPISGEIRDAKKLKTSADQKIIVIGINNEEVGILKYD